MPERRSVRQRIARRVAVAVVATASLVLVAVVPATAANTAPVNTALPSISDTTPHDGNALTGYRGSWTGLSPITFAYQWSRCDVSGAACVDVAGATTSTYRVGPVDIGSTLALRITATNSLGTTVATSLPTAVVAATAPSNTSLPTVTGTATSGVLLTGSPGTWTGTAPISYAYRWKRCDTSGASCTSITGATSSTYTVDLADAGSTLRLAVTATNDGGSTSATSAATTVVALVAPSNAVLPTVSDVTPHDGNTLTAYTGSWVGTAPITYAFQWERCAPDGTACASIPDATASTYTVTSSDVGSTLDVRVFASNGGGTGTATSLPTAIVAASAPVNTSWPTITGSATNGSVLQASTGTWTGTPPITYSFRWRRCDLTGANCTSITGATSSTYTVSLADASARLRVTVKATNAGGSRSMSSAPTGVIGDVAPSNIAPPTLSDTTPHDLDVITVYPGSWVGTDPITYAYQWLRCDGTGSSCSAVAGATSSTYTVVSTDIGSTFAARVTATNDAGSAVATTAVTSAAVAAPPVAVAPPAVTGIAQDGGVLSGTSGSWTGTAPITLSTKWMRCNTTGGSCITIKGATATTYTATSTDVGSTLRFAVNATNAAGAASASALTGVVAPIAPAVTTQPALAGVAEEGLALSTSDGAWTGTTPMKTTYAWLRCDTSGGACASVTGATLADYTATSADVGSTLRATVTQTNAAGAANAISDPSGVVAAPGAVRFADTFDGADGLITNEYAFYNPTHSDAVLSPDWQTTSGSLFRRSGTAWTGVPDDVTPDATSSNGTGSAVFRLRTTRSDFGDVAVSFSLLDNGLVSTATTPAADWDGVHVWVRYVDETQLYAISVDRRDGTMRVKKKCPGGPSNGGVYYDLVPSISSSVPYGTWQNVQVTVHDAPDGSVVLEVYRNGSLVVRAVDAGVGCAPITGAGRVGMRGDNADFQFDDFVVRDI